MTMHSKMMWLGAGLMAGFLGLAPLVTLTPLAEADRAKPAAAAELSLDAIVSKHLAALGGADLLRATRSFTFVSTGEKAGKKYTKTIYFARPGKLRVDFETDEAKGSKGFDGKVGWMKKAGEAVVAMNAEETASMKLHADMDEPLLDHAKRGIAVKLIGTSEVAGKPAYELELTLAGGKVERHFLDASTFLVVQITSTEQKDGKAITNVVRPSDYRKVQGRMINHAVEYQHEGQTGRGVLSQIAFDKPFDPALFAMPKS